MQNTQIRLPRTSMFVDAVSARLSQIVFHLLSCGPFLLAISMMTIPGGVRASQSATKVIGEGSAAKST